MTAATVVWPASLSAEHTSGIDDYLANVWTNTSWQHIEHNPGLVWRDRNWPPICTRKPTASLWLLGHGAMWTQHVAFCGSIIQEIISLCNITRQRGKPGAGCRHSATVMCRVIAPWALMNSTRVVINALEKNAFQFKVPRETWSFHAVKRELRRWKQQEIQSLSFWFGWPTLFTGGTRYTTVLNCRDEKLLDFDGYTSPAHRWIASHLRTGVKMPWCCLGLGPGQKIDYLNEWQAGYYPLKTPSCMDAYILTDNFKKPFFSINEIRKARHVLLVLRRSLHGTTNPLMEYGWWKIMTRYPLILIEDVDPGFETLMNATLRNLGRFLSEISGQLRTWMCKRQTN